MDITLRCNSLKCRAQLTDRAVVTTCSHIYCLTCAETLGLSGSGGTRICPACETHLMNPDDVVNTGLNPSDDYKTSVLSGLNPSIIMECAGRGLAFYSYQTTQEIMYQEYLAKSLADKYATISSQMDKIIHDANAEIMHLRDKMAAMQTEQKNLEQRNHELVEAFREKSRNQQQLQKLYQALKTQVMASAVQTAASDDAEQTLHTVTANRFIDRLGARGGLESQGTAYNQGPGLATNRRRSRGSSGDGADTGAAQFSGQPRGYSSQSHTVGVTPGAHRTRLPIPAANRPLSLMTADGSQGPNFNRQPLGTINPNTVATSGYGLSAGMRIGKSTGAPFSRSGPGTPRPSRMGPPSTIPMR